MSLVGKLILATMFSAGMFATVQAAEQPRVAKTQAGTFQVKVSQGNLSLEATQAPLIQIFQEIGKQAKISVDSNIGPEEKVTIYLDRVPLEEGIKRLSNNVTIVYGETPSDKGYRITKIVVLSDDKRKVTRSQDVKAAKPSKAAEPEPRAEPFKFEFDPTKSMKK